MKLTKTDLRDGTVRQDPNIDGLESLVASRALLERRVADTLDGLLDDDALKELIGNALLSTKEVWISCPHCNKRSRAPKPDPMAQVKALILLRQHAVGAPAQRVDVQLVVRPGLPVSELTDEELAAIVRADASGSS